MRTGTFALMALMTAASVWAQIPENARMVRVGVFMVRPDGSIGGSAGFGGDRSDHSFSTLVWVGQGGCSFGAADLNEGPSEPPEGAIDAWALRGQVTSIAAEQAAVQVEWRRLRTAGSAVDGPWTSRQLSLAQDQLIALESVGSATDVKCGSPSVTFGARFGQPFPWTTASTRGTGGGRGSGSGTGTGRGSGGAVRTVSPRNVAPYNAELWLVHSVPGKPDTVVPAMARIEGGAGTFSFAPMRLPVTTGTFTVTISGRLQLVPGDPRPRMLTFSADRAVSFTPNHRPTRDPTETRPEGGTVNSSGMPGPDDVVAFEMPPLKAAGAPSVPDKFSIRLRLRPVAEGK